MLTEPISHVTVGHDFTISLRVTNNINPSTEASGSCDTPAPVSAGLHYQYSQGLTINSVTAAKGTAVTVDESFFWLQPHYLQHSHNRGSERDPLTYRCGGQRCEVHQHLYREPWFSRPCDRMFTPSRKQTGHSIGSLRAPSITCLVQYTISVHVEDTITVAPSHTITALDATCRDVSDAIVVSQGGTTTHRHSPHAPHQCCGCSVVWRSCASALRRRRGLRCGSREPCLKPSLRAWAALRVGRRSRGLSKASSFTKTLTPLTYLGC
jgi:hypothetical protein